ncbi:MAG: tail fiber domain-containing protein, partial [Solirubrobacteraceae bacterium]
GPTGPATGPAGGALAGSYPDPLLNITGGDSGATACAGGEAVSGLSASGALSCGPGVLKIGNDSFGVGSLALSSDTSGGANSAFGYAALEDDTTAGINTAVGFGALGSDVSSGNDTAVGYDALDAATGPYNAALGTQALAGLRSGQQDTGAGEEAGRNMATGSDDTLVGYLAGVNYSADESSDIDIGADVDGTGGESNVIRIGGVDGTGTGEQNRLYIPAAESTVSSGGALEIDPATGQIGVATSSRRFKTDIRRIGPWVQRLLMALRPVSFHYKPQYVEGQRNPLEYGLIAEQVARVDPNLVVYGPGGRPFSVAYQELPVLLLAEVRRQERQIERLESQRRELDRLEREVGALLRRRG